METPESTAASPEPFPPLETLAAQILAVTQDLAHVQALQPQVRDDTGFNNADYGLGLVLAQVGDAEGAAAMLLRYPRQASSAGVTPEALLHYATAAAAARATDDLPPESLGGSGGGDGARRDRVARAQVAGLLVWIADPAQDRVLFNGVGLSSATKQALRTDGTRASVGWWVPTRAVWHVLHALPPEQAVHGRERLETLAGPEPARRVAPTRARRGDDGSGVVRITHAPGTSEGGTVTTSNYRTDAGAAVREIIKTIGAARYDRNGGWALPRAGVEVDALWLALDDRDDVALPASATDRLAAMTVEERGAAERHRALVEQGILPVFVRAHAQPTHLWLTTPRRHETFNGAMRRIAARWDGAALAYPVPLQLVPVLLRDLVQDATLECAALVSAAVVHLGAERAAAAVVPVGPAPISARTAGAAYTPSVRVPVPAPAAPPAASAIPRPVRTTASPVLPPGPTPTPTPASATTPVEPVALVAPVVRPPRVPTTARSQPSYGRRPVAPPSR